MTYATKPDTTVTAYGVTLTLFGQPADRNVSVEYAPQGWMTCNTRTTTGRCGHTARVTVKRAVIIDVNEGRTRGNGLPAHRVEGLTWKIWHVCQFHLVSTLDTAYTLPV